MESNLLEIKARCESLDFVRKKLDDLKARHAGTFHQIDTYFNVPQGRLKLREIDGTDKALLIYYEREDISRPKRSNILILEIQNPKSFKTFFGKVFGKKIVIDKVREIYILKETQIHLDEVEDSGAFIEFEKKITDLNQDHKTLEELMNDLKIKEEDLLKGSYSDIIKKEE